MKKLFAPEKVGERRVVWKLSDLPDILSGRGRNVEIEGEGVEKERSNLLSKIKAALGFLTRQPENPERRKALISMARGVVALSVLSLLPSGAQAEEISFDCEDLYENKSANELADAIMQNLKNSTLEQIREFASKYLIFDGLITATFTDFIYGGVKGKPAGIAKGLHRIEFGRLHPGKDRLAKAFESNDALKQELQDRAGRSGQDFKIFLEEEIVRLEEIEGRSDDEERTLAYLEKLAHIHEIPGVAGASLAAVSAGLGLKYFLGNKQSKEEVAHTLKETGLGVYLLTGLSVMMEHAVINDPTLPLVVEEYNRSKETDRSDSQKLDNTFDHLFRSVSNSYLLCAFSLTSTAFGDAALMGKRLTTMCELFVPDILAIFVGKSLEQGRTIASQVSNSYLREFLLKYLSGDGDIDEKTIEEIKAGLIKDFSFELIGTMDRAQIGVGDIGPLVGACQSFGVKEALKTGIAEWLVNAVAVQSTLSSVMLNRKFGFDAKPQGFETACEYAIQTIVNLIPGLGLDREEIKTVLRGRNITPELAGKGSKIVTLRGAVDGALAMPLSIIGHFSTTASEYLKEGAEVPPEDKDRLAEVLMGLKEMKEAIEKDSDDTDDDKQILELLERAGHVAAADMTSKDTLNEIKTAVSDMEDKMKKRFEEVEFKIASSDDPAKALLDFLGDFKRPKFKEVIGFHAYEHKFGPTVAETMFNVLIQGLCLTSITKIIGAFYDSPIFKVLPYEVQLPINCVIHALLSAVADNWGDQIVNANHMFQYFGVPEVAKKHKLDISKIDLAAVPEGGPAVLGRYELFLTEITKDMEDQSKARDVYMDLLYEFILGKHISMAVSAAGGELTLIGNSPHFMAFIGELKKYITMQTSLENLMESKFKTLFKKIAPTVATARAAAILEFNDMKKALAGMSFEDLMENGPLKRKAA